MKEFILRLIALILGYQKADEGDKQRIAELEAERNALLKEHNELNDPALLAQIQAVLDNAQTQPPDSAPSGPIPVIGGTGGPNIPGIDLPIGPRPQPEPVEPTPRPSTQPPAEPAVETPSRPDPNPV